MFVSLAPFSLLALVSEPGCISFSGSGFRTRVVVFLIYFWIQGQKGQTLLWLVLLPYNVND